MLSFQTSSARQSSLIAEAILHLGHRSESGSAMKCGRGRNGAPGRIRTCTVLLLREPPPAGWATGASLDNERTRERSLVSAFIWRGAMKRTRCNETRSEPTPRDRTWDLLLTRQALSPT